MFIYNQQGQIIITVVVEGATGQYLRSKCQLLSLFIADHSEVETAGAVESRKQQVRDKATHPVNRSGFPSHRQNS
jgi:hypothetical protein